MGDKEADGPKVTILPAGRARGALSVTDWAIRRAGMRDKGQRVLMNKRDDAKGGFPRKPRPPMTPR
jgi:hypothetical protein